MLPSIFIYNGCNYNPKTLIKIKKIWWNFQNYDNMANALNQYYQANRAVYLYWSHLQVQNVKNMNSLMFFFSKQANFISFYFIHVFGTCTMRRFS